jgi:hypothetical protein
MSITQDVMKCYQFIRSMMAYKTLTTCQEVDVGQRGTILSCDNFGEPWGGVGGLTPRSGHFTRGRRSGTLYSFGIGIWYLNFSTPCM